MKASWDECSQWEQLAMYAYNEIRDREDDDEKIAMIKGATGGS